MTRQELESKSDSELLEIQQSYWTVGAADDDKWIGECAENFNRDEAIDFILDCEANSQRE